MTGMRGKGRGADPGVGGGDQGRGRGAGGARGKAEAGAKVETGAGINPRVVIGPVVAPRARRDHDQTQDTNERSLPLVKDLPLVKEESQLLRQQLNGNTILSPLEFRIFNALKTGLYVILFGSSSWIISYPFSCRKIFFITWWGSCTLTLQKLFFFIVKGSFITSFVTLNFAANTV